MIFEDLRYILLKMDSMQKKYSEVVPRRLAKMKTWVTSKLCNRRQEQINSLQATWGTKQFSLADTRVLYLAVVLSICQSC